MKRNIYATNGHGAVEFNPYPLEMLARQRATSPLFYDCVWIDGELVPAEDVRARNEPGIFEEIRCYETERGPAIFRLEAHLHRFLQAARALGAGNLRYTFLDLRRAVHVTAHVNNLSAGAIRPIVYVERQAGGDAYASVAVVTAAQSAGAGELPAARRLMSAPLAQHDAGPVLTHEALQSRSARSTRAREAAHDNGFDEAILVDRDGAVADCTGDTLFMVRNGAVYTWPAEPGGDVARDTAITLLNDLGFHVVERPLFRRELDGADELFLCGVASEITPVSRLDGRRFDDDWAGSVTNGLRQLYAATVRGEGRRSRGWLEYVMLEPLF